MMIVMPSYRFSIATCLKQKPTRNGITDPRRKKDFASIKNVSRWAVNAQVNTVPETT
jgi:hypothetical protein